MYKPVVYLKLIVVYNDKIVVFTENLIGNLKKILPGKIIVNINAGNNMTSQYCI